MSTESREIALSLAVQARDGRDTTSIVSAAEKFDTFLQGPTGEAGSDPLDGEARLNSQRYRDGWEDALTSVLNHPPGEGWVQAIERLRAAGPSGLALR